MVVSRHKGVSDIGVLREHPLARSVKGHQEQSEELSHSAIVENTCY